MLTIGSLFSGIAGLEVGLLAAFHEARIQARVVWQVEIDEFCSRVLAKHFPETKRYRDVRDVGADAPPVDLICGGFPCQDISNAGKRAGIDGGRSGLWSEFARIVGLLRPRFVLVENVSALLGRGLDRVLGDLATLGYDARWSTLRAADVGAPHLRERVFIIAWRRDVMGDTDRLRAWGGHATTGTVEAGHPGARPVPGRSEACEVLADGHVDGCEGERRGGLLDGERAACGHDADGRGGADVPDAASAGLARTDDGAERAGRTDAGRGGVLGQCRAFMSCRRVATRIDERRGRLPVCDECFAWAERSLGDAIGEGLEERSRERGDEGSERPAAERASSLANPRCLGVERPGDRGELGGSAGAAQGQGLQRQRHGRAAGDGGAEAMGDAAEPGREGPEWIGGAPGERREALDPERSGDAGSEGRTPQSSVGSHLDGLPFDVAGHRWPAGRGEAQQEHEPPRTIPQDVKVPERPAKLRALGNAVVPQCSLVMGRALIDIARLGPGAA